MFGCISQRSLSKRCQTQKNIYSKIPFVQHTKTDQTIYGVKHQRDYYIGGELLVIGREPGSGFWELMMCYFMN